MNINRSHAVDVFKQYGQLWYHGAQKFPIDAYKDVILLHEFVINTTQLAHSGPHAQSHLKQQIEQWNQVYRTKNYEDPHYGWLVEMMYRRRIGSEYIKALYQSVLLNTTSIWYANYDELKVYIYGVAEVVGIMVAEIIGCAPPWILHTQAMWEWLRLVHMMLDLRSDYHHGHRYIPQSEMDHYQITDQDIARAVRTWVASQWLRDCVKYYIDLHESLCAYALQWIWYVNATWHIGIAQTIKDYESIVTTIQEHDYNVFHPRFSDGLVSKIIWYPLYRFYSMIWTH